MEDGVTLAITLEKAGKQDVQLGLRGYEAIRYGRVHRAQQTGITTREQWHKADWDKIWKDPKSLHLKRETWLLDFDAEPHAYEVVDDVLKNLRQGKEVKTNGVSEPADKNRLGTAIAQEVDQLA